MNSVRPDYSASASNVFTLLCDDRCEVGQRLTSLVKLWDRNGTFRFIERTSGGPQSLIEELDQSPWSLLLIDEDNERWIGPEAIPIILKNLPFGKIAAVLYILPGTMWFTKELYQKASRNRPVRLARSTAA